MSALLDVRVHREPERRDEVRQEQPSRLLSSADDPPCNPSNRAGSRSGYEFCKRTIDLVVSAAVLMVLAVPIAVIVIAIRLTSDGPAFFRQVRVGKDQRPFVMLKFRSMFQDARDDVHRSYVSAMLANDDFDSSPGQTIYKLTEDSRITRMGLLLRRTSLDELPQLVNVLMGQMALVGPRPPLPWEVVLFEPQFEERFEVKPGLTGLWQVSGRNNLVMQQALELDVHYVRERSLTLDLAIMVRTLPVVLSGRGAS